MSANIILVFLMMMLGIIIAAPLYSIELNSSSPGQYELFEGDLRIPEALIQKHYNMSSISLQVHKNNSREVRAAGNDIRLWENGIVPYTIACGFSNRNKQTIRRAMDRWEDTTCLRFVQRGSQWNYLHFQNLDLGCYSTAIGREGLLHIINLNENGCTSFGIILHELGHAIGFWHEQSRPDRDAYIRINANNIKFGDRHNFMSRNDFDIDYQGSGYDYGSIMHYSERAFVKDNCRGCKTIEVTNSAEYNAQGRPRLGQLNDLSSSDIQQTNRLYSCVGTGVYGRLRVRVRYGRRLMDKDWFWDLSDPYVRITAVDKWGTKHVRQTCTKDSTLNPTWNEDLVFPRSEWQFFRIRVFDDDWIFYHEPLSMSETVVITPGSHNNQKHCDDTLCNGYVYYDYSI